MTLFRIVYLIDTISCDTRGTEKQLLETIKRLDKGIFEPFLICLWESEWMKSYSFPCPCTVLNYHGFIKPDFPSLVHRFAKIITEKRIDIIQTFFEDSIFIGYLAGLFSKPHPILFSSRRDIGLGKNNQPWYHSLYKMILPYVNKKFSGIIANSKMVREYVALREKTPKGKIKVIYNGVSIPENTGKKPDVFQKYRADVWIGVVASLTPVKRHDLLLNAFARLKEKTNNINVHTLILGDGVLQENLENLASELGIREYVHFEGAVNNVPEYLYNIDIGVLCSDREGLSNAILEYMACSLPVVATAVGGNTELVNEDNGICVPPDDVDALAAGLLRLIEDKELRKKMGNTSLKKIKDNFSWDKAMAELESYYRSLVKV